MSAARAIGVATLVVAALDACEDMIYCRLVLHVTPAQLFTYIASAVLGPHAAIRLGWPAVVLGIALHMGVAFVVVCGYFLLSRRIAVMRSRPVMMGALYGVGVYLVMHYLVVPLTRVPRIGQAHWGSELANQLFAHVFMVGIPAALILTRGAREDFRCRENFPP